MSIKTFQKGMLYLVTFNNGLLKQHIKEYHNVISNYHFKVNHLSAQGEMKSKTCHLEIGNITYNINRNRPVQLLKLTNEKSSGTFLIRAMSIMSASIMTLLVILMC